MSDSDYALPPATFEFLTISLKTQTEMQLGILYFGEEKERPQPDFRMARHTIDMLAMLQDKTKGNLSMEEQRLIENSLTELRFRFVQALEHSKKDSAAEASAETKSTSEPSRTEPEETKEGQPAG
jgi:hypothetical protein